MVYSDKTYYNCFSQKKVKNCSEVFVGDRVEFEEIKGEFVITKVLLRTNKLIRPFVTNISQLFIFVSPIPEPDLILVDKLIINAKENKIEPILLVNKCDIETNLYSKIKKEYEKANIDIINISTKTNLNIDLIKQKLKNNVSALAGQSATGKTSLLNLICGTNNKVNSVSEKNLRGKNTTTNAELIVLNDNSFILDTAGFSRLELMKMDPVDIKKYYDEFIDTECLYKNCNHIVEGNSCSVIKNLYSKNSKIDANRYDRYKQIYLQSQENWRKRYD